MEKLISLKNDRRTVFVSDIHGDYLILNRIFSRYGIGTGTRYVFLGDYIDRGYESLAVVKKLFGLRKRFPQDFILLMGNHEFGSILSCGGNFWENTASGLYINDFLALPLAVEIGNIVALHGALPDILKLSEIDEIEIPQSAIESEEELQAFVSKSQSGQKLLDLLTGYYDDYLDKTRVYLNVFDNSEFQRVMKNINKEIIIRGHQSTAPELMFNGKCITIIASRLYGRPTVVVVEPGVDVKSFEDVKIDRLYNEREQ